MLSILTRNILVIDDALLVLFTHYHLFSNSLAPLALLIFGNVSLASVSKLGEEVLPQVVDHNLHQFGLVLLKPDPILPPLEARSCGFRVIALKVISKLLVSSSLQSCLEIINMLTHCDSLLFMLTNFLILGIYYISSLVLHRLEDGELLSMCIDPP